MEGYLQKLSSGTVKRWQSRYFELSGHYLKYFEEKGKKDGSEEEGIKGTIDLENLCFCTVEGSELHLEMTDGEGVLEIKLKAKSGQNAITWADEINAAVKANTQERLTRSQTLGGVSPTSLSQDALAARSNSIGGSEAHSIATQKVERKSSLAGLFRRSAKPAEAVDGALMGMLTEEEEELTPEQQAAQWAELVQQQWAQLAQHSMPPPMTGGAEVQRRASALATDHAE